MNAKECAFRKVCLFDKEEIICSIELTLDYYKHDEELNYSDAMRKNMVEIFEKFLAAIKKAKLPKLANSWKYYEYEIAGDSILLCLLEATEIEIDEWDELSSMEIESSHKLLEVKCDYLDVSKFAKLHEVTTKTVNMWLRRGKLKNAKLVAGEWLIPALEEKPERRYGFAQYNKSSEDFFAIEEYPFVALSESIDFSPNKESGCIVCSFCNWKTDFFEKIELTKDEAEELEYRLIASGGYKAEGRVQFVPMIEKGTVEEPSMATIPRR